MAPSAKSFTDYYKVLTLAPNAKGPEIKAAYHKAALLHHPDKVTDDVKAKAEAEERMKVINAAYEVLGDPVRRQAFDNERHWRTHGKRSAEDNEPIGRRQDDSETQDRATIEGGSRRTKGSKAYLRRCEEALAERRRAEDQHTAYGRPHDKFMREQQIMDLKDYDSSPHIFHRGQQYAGFQYRVDSIVSMADEVSAGFTDLTADLEDILALGYSPSRKFPDVAWRDRLFELTGDLRSVKGQARDFRSKETLAKIREDGWSTVITHVYDVYTACWKMVEVFRKAEPQFIAALKEHAAGGEVGERCLTDLFLDWPKIPGDPPWIL